MSFGASECASERVNERADAANDPVLYASNPACCVPVISHHGCLIEDHPSAIRLGLVNHTTDGHTFAKDDKDDLIIIALGKRQKEN